MQAFSLAGPQPKQAVFGRKFPGTLHMSNVQRPMSKVKKRALATLDIGLWTLDIPQLLAQLEPLHLPGRRVRQLRHK